MPLHKAIPSIMLSALISLSAAAQSPAPTEASKADQQKAEEELRNKAVALLGELKKEAPGLRAAENRIRAQAAIADLLWQYDEKSARDLFKQALAGLDELASQDAGQDEEGADSGEIQQSIGVQQHRQLRQQVLQLLSRHDPKLAHAALRGKSHGAGPDDSAEVDAALTLAENLVASDPKEALQVAEENLDKALSPQLSSLISDLRARDKDAAAQLLADVMKRLRATALAKDPNAASLAANLLGSGAPGQDSQSILDENSFRDLLNLVVTAALSADPAPPVAEGGALVDVETDFAGFVQVLEPLLAQVDKYEPARAAAVRQKLDQLNNSADPGAKALKPYQTMIDTGSAADLLEAAAKAPASIKQTLYQQAAAKAINDGDFKRAQQIADEDVPDPAQRKALLDSIEQQGLQQAIAAGKLDEVQQKTARRSATQRAGALLQLAAAAAGKGNKKLALQALDEARALLPAQAANYTELQTLLQIAAAYGAVEPAKGFDVVEPIVDQLNRLLEAAAVLDGFEFWRQFKDGELIQASHLMVGDGALGSGGPGVVGNLTQQCAASIGGLARADFTRAKAAADRFLRPEVRTIAHLALAQNALSKPGDAGRAAGPINARFSIGRNVFSIGRNVIYIR